MNLKRSILMGWLTGMAGAGAAIELAVPFQEGAVLQRERPVPVWGKALPNSSVKVTFGGQSVTGKADALGKWQVALTPMPANSSGQILAVSENGGPAVEIKDVLVGEVWLASGQSNMEWPIKASRPEDQALAAAGPVPGMRLFQVPLVVSAFRQEKVVAKWVPATPETAKEFSAVAYFYGKRLVEELKVPVGLIESAWGGSRIEPWWAEEGFAQVPELSALATQRRAALPGFPEYDQPFRKHLASLRDWTTQAEKALDVGAVVPEAPKPPTTLSVGSGSETGTYQAMIHPLVPYALRGFLWYQGESNNGEDMLYATKMKVLIDGWRHQFQNAEAPFYYVQLAPYTYEPAKAEGLPRIWWAQQSVLKLVPHTGMVVINDIGTIGNIHPPNKSEVARRLSLWALSDAYHQKNLVKSGPLFSAFKVDGHSIRIAFSETGSGLSTRDGKPPTLFEIAGIDEAFSPATAVISADGKTLTLTSDRVPEPVQARFAWSQIAEPNLMNKEGLPAAAFHTHWPVDPPLGKLISIGAPIASSHPNLFGWNSGVTDGVWGAVAGTCYATDAASNFPKTVTVDLGAAKQVNAIRYGVPLIGATKTLALSVSVDGKDFTELQRREFAPKKEARSTVRFDPKSIRYVRATFLDHHAQQDNYDANFVFLSEIEAYSPDQP